MIDDVNNNETKRVTVFFIIALRRKQSHESLGKDIPLKFPCKPNARQKARESYDHAKDKVKKRSREKPIFDEAVDLHLKCRECRECPEKSDDDAHPEIIADLDLVSQDDKQESDQKRPGNIDEKGREREFIENIGKRRNIEQIPRNGAECSSESDEYDL